MSKVIKSMDHPCFSCGSTEKRPMRIVCKSFLFGKEYSFEEYRNGNFVTIEHFHNYEEALEFWNVLEHIPYIVKKANPNKDWGLSNPYVNLLSARPSVTFIDWRHMEFTNNTHILTYYFLIDYFYNAERLKELINSQYRTPQWLKGELCNDEYILALEFTGKQFQEFDECSIYFYKFRQPKKFIERIYPTQEFEELTCSCIINTLRYPNLSHIHRLKTLVIDYYN